MPLPRAYALASHVRHPGNVYLREADLLPAIDRWLLVIFAPHRLEQSIGEMEAAQDPGAARLDSPGQDTQALIADCDTRLARYQAALDAGADPQAVAEGTRQVKAERAAALARDASQARHTAVRQLTQDDIRALITGLGDLCDVIRDAEPTVKVVHRGSVPQRRGERGRQVGQLDPDARRPPTSPRNGSSAGPSSAASSTNTSEPHKSPGQHRWPSSGTPQPRSAR